MTRLLKVSAQTSTKRFLAGLMAGALGALCLWLLLWAGQLGRAHPNNAWIEGALNFKLARAEAQPSPKTLIVAGSSAMFGIDSGALEAAFDRPAVNLGVNAGLSLPVILASAAPVIRAGDLVLLPLEYPLYNRDEAVSASLIHWVNSHPGALWELPSKRALGVIAQTSLHRLLEGYRGIPEGFAVSGDYGVQHLDLRGDQTGTARALREPRHWRFLNSLPVETYGETARRGRFDGKTLRAFRDAVLNSGACPIFLPAPLLYKPYYADSPVEANFYANLPTQVRRAGLMWVGTPEDAMYGADDFFDTNFHLVDEARTRHTQRLIQWLGDQPFERCQRYYQNAAQPSAYDSKE